MGRSTQISVTSTTALCITSCKKMSRILFCVLLGLVAISLSANAEEEQDSQEVESFLDESVELARHKRDADPAKGGKKNNKRKGGKKNKKPKKPKKGKKAEKKNKNK